MTPEEITRALAAFEEDERWAYDYINCHFCWASIHLLDGTGIADKGLDGHEPDCPYAAAVRWVQEHP